MIETNQSPKEAPNFSAPTMISLLIRFTLGPLFLVFGATKLERLKDNADMIRSGFADTWLSLSIVTPIAYTIPFWEILIGLSLTLGFYYRWGLLATGSLIALLTIGLAIQGEYDSVSRNMIFLIFVFFGLIYSANCKWSLDGALGKTRCD